MKVAYNFLHCGFHIRRRPSLSRPDQGSLGCSGFSGGQLAPTTPSAPDRQDVGFVSFDASIMAFRSIP